MKTTIKAAFLLLAICMTGMSQVVLAEPEPLIPCAAETDAVDLAIGDAEFIGKRADRSESSLREKLQAAIAKIKDEKFSDAIGKLIDISEKADALASAKKPKLKDDMGISVAVLAATVCINGL
jgi:hypothetical protein